ncbi:Crp/Fnr family transcriptional regulator [Variovorax sp. VNK109]|jgi:CRP/FNR family cyclic AMP-dependent transcriptional regulator|uniref:Crp/Fnr family transcriptional regulator n=1 Tax=Variovorax sp. VNK109 TaxID=3400919 RepID=UPI003C0BD4FC
MPSPSVEEQLKEAGLELAGTCQGMAGRGPRLLHNAALLEDFTADEMDALGSAMPMLRAAPGQVLINEGEVGEWMLLLLSGTVDVTKRTPTGEVSRLAVIREGAAIGEMSMLDGEPRYATCTAIDAVEAGVLTRSAIALLIREHPGVGAKLLVKLTQLLAQRLRNTSNQLVKMVQAAADSQEESEAR